MEIKTAPALTPILTASACILDIVPYNPEHPLKLWTSSDGQPPSRVALVSYDVLEPLQEHDANIKGPDGEIVDEQSDHMDAAGLDWKVGANADQGEG